MAAAVKSVMHFDYKSIEPDNLITQLVAAKQRQYFSMQAW